MYAPIALFAYNRPLHLQKCINALKLCPESIDTDLYIFCDGPKIKAHSDQLIKINETRQVANSVSGFRSVQLHINSDNLGLSKSLINGISLVLSKSNEVIVIEDDIFVGLDFLKFMNLALYKYQNEMLVAGISGYSFPIGQNKPYFSRTGSCWAWATYKRVWMPFIANKEGIDLSQIPKNELEIYNVYKDYYQKMFSQNKQGLINSWAINFYTFYFINKQFFLFSGANLADNSGFDGSGSHKTNDNFLTKNNPIKRLEKIEFPHKIEELTYIRKAITKVYKKGIDGPHILRQFLSKLLHKIRN